MALFNDYETTAAQALRLATHYAEGVFSLTGDGELHFYGKLLPAELLDKMGPQALINVLNQIDEQVGRWTHELEMQLEAELEAEANGELEDAA